MPRPSFRQLLLLAFLLLALLMGGVALRGLVTLEQLLQQARDGAGSALTLNARLERLAQQHLTMERAARQFLVLGDGALREIHERAAEDAGMLLHSLVQQTGSPALAERWADPMATVTRELRGAPGPLAARDARVAGAFRELAALHAELAELVRDLTASRNDALQAELEAGRLALARQVLGAIALSLVLALALALTLARPLRRVQQAIVALGENRLDTRIDIRGPSDVREIGRRLDDLRQRLAELDADKARFLRHVSHELKTPLAALREGVALLGDGVAGPLTDSQREIARILADNTDALQRRIEDLLRFNAVAFAAQRLVRQPTALADLVQQQVQGQALLARSRGVAVQAEGPPLQVAVDPELLGTALSNLLSNAIRYSAPGALVSLRWWALDEDLTIEVADQGPGIAPAERLRIFEPFFRGRQQPEGGLPGTGIGLAIVAETVAAHGGRVRLMDAAALAAPGEPTPGAADAVPGAAPVSATAAATGAASTHDRHGACFRIELPHVLLA